MLILCGIKAFNTHTKDSFIDLVLAAKGLLIEAIVDHAEKRRETAIIALR